MRVITVPFVKNKESETALSVAFELAEKLGASIHGYHLMPGNRGLLRPDTIFSRFTQDEPQDLRSVDELKSLCNDAQLLFTKLVDERGFSLSLRARYQEGGALAIWNKFKGGPEPFFSIIGPVSDLIILARPNKKSSLLAKSFMLCALLYSRRPVLILPKRKRPSTVGNRILLAWNQSNEAIESIVTALPLLQQADSVHVVCSGKGSRTGPSLKHLKQYLRCWGVEVNLTQTEGDSAEKEISDVYADTNSDLLIMGAYSRNHWREKVLGGMTDHILNHTEIPTLMLHR